MELSECLEKQHHQQKNWGKKKKKKLAAPVDIRSKNSFHTILSSRITHICVALLLNRSR